MRIARWLAALAAIALFAVLATRSPRNTFQPENAPVCRPIDSAWAVLLHVVDAETRRPVGNVHVSTMMQSTRTDSSGWACLRDLVEDRELLSLYRLGYRPQEMPLRGRIGEVVANEVPFRRVERPCCDLRGPWRITLELDRPSEMHPNPRGRTVSGEVLLGPRHHPPRQGDDLDSLVRIVRGMHAVDFTAFFDGPVARDVSTSVFGSGPDLHREVEAVILEGDRAEITFIPRMTHGSLSLSGRVRGDTIRGEWVQNAYCCGARGDFIMVRTGPVDTLPAPAAPETGRPRTAEEAGTSGALESVVLGGAPESRWRPELMVAPNGRLWLATQGLYVADSFGGRWRRVFGGSTDPVHEDELRIGVAMAFVGSDTAVLGLDMRLPNMTAPHVYRTTDRGATWTSVALPDLREVRGLSAIASSVWLAGSVGRLEPAFLRSSDAGASWTRVELPARLRQIHGMFRESESVGYLRTDADSGAPALWRTADAGSTWVPLATPHDQRLHEVPSYGTRVEEIATVGDRLLVREYGKVFVADRDSIKWTPLVGVDHIASEPGGDHVFVLYDSLGAALLDRSLRVVWRVAEPLAIREARDVEQVLWRDGAAYISTTYGSVFRVKDGVGRELRPTDYTPKAEGATIIIR